MNRKVQMTAKTSVRKNVCDVYCIGAQKAATSWLHHVINAHPRMYKFPNSKPVTSTNKEAHFWDWNRARGEDWYRELLRPPHANLLSMDFTPEYALLSTEDVTHCKSLSPDAKIIYILRHPVCRAVSALRMHFRWQDTFTRIIFDNFLIHIYKKAQIKAHSQYVKNYKRWVSVYGEGQIKLLFYEKILAEPAAVASDVLAFLDISMDEMNAEELSEFNARLEKKVWKSESFPVDDATVFFLTECLQDCKSAAEREFGIKFSETLQR